MTNVNTETAAPQIPINLITTADVRASIKRAKQSLEKAAGEIVWQIEMEAWRTLGYSSWNAMREAEYGDAAFMVPRKDRPELVGRMRRAGLTQQEIADTAGIDRKTVRSDLNGDFPHSDDPAPPTITNARGQERPAFYATSKPLADDETVDVTTGEITTRTDNATTDPAPTESVVTTITCPTCHGTGKVTR